MSNKSIILALMGKSGAGKDTLVNDFCHDHWWANKIVSCTTRPPRDYEQEGTDYYFITEKEFFSKIENGEMLEHTVFRDWFYGTDITTIHKGVNLGVYNPQGYLNLLKAVEHAADPNLIIVGIYIQVDDKIRLLRSLQREEHPDVEEVCRRFFADKADFDFLDRGDHQEVIRMDNNSASDKMTVMYRIKDIICDLEGSFPWELTNSSLG